MKPTIEYMRLDEFMGRFHPRNPKQHDIGAIITSIRQFGYIEPPTVDETTRYVVAGHGRGEALRMMMNGQEEAPSGIEVDTTDGMWMLPVVRGLSFRDEQHVNAYLVASNRLTTLGGWDDTLLTELLQEVALHDNALLESTGYDGDDLDMLLNSFASHTDLLPLDAGASASAVSTTTESNHAESTSATNIGAPQDSGVRMVQLYFNSENIESFSDMLAVLGGIFGTDNTTDTVFKAVEHAHSTLSQAL